jgi:hypothetical protein
MNKQAGISKGRTILIFIALALFTQPAIARYSGGSGTENNPYLIADANQFNQIGRTPDDWDKNFKLTADIDLSEYDGTKYNIIGREWTLNHSRIVLDINGGYFYWCDNGFNKIQRANLDGSNIQDIVTGSFSYSYGMALDTAGGKIYWTDSTNNKISRANLDGSNIQDIVTGLNYPYGIALDVNAGKMYWCDMYNKKIRRANLNGTGIEDIITGTSFYPMAIALDIAGGKIYYSDNWIYRICRANLNGTNKQTLTSVYDGDVSSLALDLNAGKMYWCSWQGIRRANLDGNSLENILPAAGGIALDVPAGKIYCSTYNPDLIRRYNLDSTGGETLIGSFFSGMFDGQGHKISGFNYSASPQQTGVGLFGTVTTDYGGYGKIVNLALMEPNVYAPGVLAGCIVGTLSSGQIERCRVMGGNLVCGTGGGLAGLNYSGSIIDSYTDCNIHGNDNVGGLVGSISDGFINSSYSDSNIDGNSTVGGLAGDSYQGRFTNCYSTGNIIADRALGGLIGALRYYSDAQPDWYVQRCYSASFVDGNQQEGGLVGANQNMTVYKSYWDTNTSGQQDSSGGGTGKTTAEMKTAQTFAGWGCDGIWTINEGVDYPRLLWEEKTGVLLDTPGYSGGSGTTDDPYLISTPEQLNQIGLYDCHLDKNFVLTDDIDMKGLADSNLNMIGSNASSYTPFYFTGVFDGAGHKIYNLKYTCPNVPSNYSSYAGLFRYAQGPNVSFKNVTLVDPNIDCNVTGFYAGALIGVLNDGGSVTNCIVEGGNIKGNYAAGAMIGAYFGWSPGSISNCHSNACVQSVYCAGGLIGEAYTWGTFVISECSSSGIVEGYSETGGLAGEMIDTIMTNCCSTCRVNGVSYVGGLSGYARSSDVNGCYASGNVTGNQYVGGFAGSSDSSIIRQSYSNGDVDGNSSTGGLLGYNYYSMVNNSFWDVDTSGQTGSAGGTGKSTEQMMTLATFADANWDFTNIWHLCETTNYPKLIWQLPLADIVCPDGVDFADYSYLASYWLQTDYGNCNGYELTGDGKVDLAEFAIIANYWQQAGCGNCGGADYSGDSKVDSADLILLCNNWLNSNYGSVEGAELTGDGIVNLDDILFFSQDWLTGF